MMVTTTCGFLQNTLCCWISDTPLGWLLFFSSYLLSWPYPSYPQLAHPKARAASLSAELAQIKDRWDLLRIIPASCETPQEVSIVMGHSAGWFISWKIHENPIYNWMMTGGTPTSGNHHVFKEAPGAAECRCRASSCRGGSNRGGAVRSGDREERTRGPLRGGCQTQRGQMFGLYAIQCWQSSTFFFLGGWVYNII